MGDRYCGYVGMLAPEARRADCGYVGIGARTLQPHVSQNASKSRALRVERTAEIVRSAPRPGPNDLGGSLNSQPFGS